MNPHMKDHHKNQLLQVLMFYVTGDIRAKVMQEVPAAYNDYYGQPIVKTMNVHGTTVSGQG